ncbi:High-affinity branched-chain amino acid transport ATP-binding protein LivF [Rhodoplanes serenus]|uniref:High-affinity branched-chain amino acid transport ATP-binding protein LivF n=1 Tax=Rhodoplanes serenus TaxID=200615 RepID=A0A3S4FB02_9BRAD|nr:ABC transporter ATP-binding protein [Rhodoplanes serenus]VCU10000.1 High-affinity branched-chain amino acid transport ATP-binding protein LivF [Rhodoplanes serenus]
MSATPIIEAVGLHTHLGSSHILHGVSLTVGRGEAVCLLGRNGMGKTTTLRTILGLVSPSRGEVRINGQPMTAAPPHRIARQGIALVPEGRGVFPNLTVRENLVMAARPGVDGRRVWTYERVLETFPRLAERRNNFGNQLSGGEQQMITIGRALMTNPDLIILDEATEGLAPLIRKEIWAVIRTIREAGIATLLVDKNVKDLLALCDRALVMVKGRIVLDGATAGLAPDDDALARHLGL